MGAPVLALTSGDPAGIGPRCAVLALRAGAFRGASPLAVGEPSVWRRAGWTERLAPLLDTGLGLAAPRLGRDSAAGGRASFAALALATRLAQRGLAAGLVTAPISKRAWDLAGVPFRDHTGYLKEATGAGAEMVLGAPEQGLWCALATRHVPLASVPRALDAGRVLGAARALDAALRRLGRAAPRLGLCGLNPHAGEDGLLGGEERRVLVPAAARARREGLDLRGPVAADAAWRLHRAGAFDGLVCLYHDQALVALKTAAGLGVVNWTAGIPFVRTSPGHGTGYDLAGKAEPDPSATVSAARLAVRLARSCA